MQLKQSNDVSQQYKGTIAGLKKIINEEGLTGLYKGNVILMRKSNQRRCSKTDSIGSERGLPFHVQGVLL